jgi:hypothetical protein
MNIQLPVYFYDVITTADPPRFIVACRTAEDAMQLVKRLSDTPRADAETFTVAPVRVAMVEMAVDPGSSVTVRGYQVASEVLAAALLPPPVVKEDPPVVAPVEEAILP